MGRKRIEINKDEVYGKLKTTGKFIYKGKKYLCWECECKCGNIVYASASDFYINKECKNLLHTME